MIFTRNIKTAIVILIVAICSGCQNSEQTKTSMTVTKDSFTQIIIPVREIYLDSVKNNTATEVTFPIINSGNNNLILKNIHADCHCTDVGVSQELIKPKDTAYIKVTYNATYSSYFMQNIYFTANTKDDQYLLTIKGKVMDE